MSVRIVVNRSAIQQLLRSTEAQTMLNRRAGAVARACNAQSSWGGYRVDTTAGEDRARALVYDIGSPSSDVRRDRMIRNLDQEV